MGIFLGSNLIDLINTKVLKQNIDVTYLAIEANLNQLFGYASMVGSSAFYKCDNLVSVNLPEATTIKTCAFYRCSNLASVNLPKATTIESEAFYSCSSLASVNLPKVTTIGSSAFHGCNGLVSISLPEATTIEEEAFCYCNSLVSINLPKLEQIKKSTFYNCYNLISINCSEVTSISGSVRVTRNRTTVSSYYNGAFARCSALTTVILPKVQILGPATFYGCNNLISISLPAITKLSYGSSSSRYTYQSRTYTAYVYAGAFTSCTNLSKVYLGSQCSHIGSSTFYSCYNLISLYIAYTGVATLGSVTAFYSTPISDYSTSAGRYGSIFVPASLVANYKAATNWSPYANRIFAIEHFPPE